MLQIGFSVLEKPCAFQVHSECHLAQPNIQTLSIPGTGGADQLLARAGTQRVQPAYNGVTAAQAQGFARQLLGALCSPRL